MLFIGFEPAFSGKILKKLDKELKKVNDPFFLIICIIIKSFSYIQMGLQKLQKFLADIGENAVEINNNAVNIGDVQNEIVSITFSLQYNLAIENLNLSFSYCILLLSSQN